MHPLVRWRTHAINVSIYPTSSPVQTSDRPSVNDAVLQVEPLMASAGTCNQTPYTLLSLL